MMPCRGQGSSFWKRASLQNGPDGASVLEHNQYTVSVRLVITINDQTVIVFYTEAVRLKDMWPFEPTLYFGAPVIARANQQNSPRPLQLMGS